MKFVYYIELKTVSSSPIISVERYEKIRLTKGASEKSIKMGNKTEPIILYSLQSILCMI